MIIVTVEMWPGGDKDEAYLLAVAVLTNDQTGSTTRGDYDCGLFLKSKRIWRKTHIAQYPRAKLNVWHLIKRMLEGVL